MRDKILSWLMVGSLVNVFVLMMFSVWTLMAPAPMQAEPNYEEVAVTTTAAPTALPGGTKSILIINDGPETVYYRLFSNCNTVGDAVAGPAGSIALLLGEFKEYKFDSDSTDNCGPGSYFSSMSFITASATATVRLESK